MPSGEFPKWYSDTDYFVCLEKHKIACKYWLNGGDVQTDRGCNDFVDVYPFSDYNGNWCETFWYMTNDYVSRIKPRTEKRWIAVKRKDPSVVYAVTSDSLEGIKSYVSEKYWQFIEIEVEAQQ